MAIFHLSISNGSKSKGKVAAIRAAYLTRSGAFADRDDLVFATSSNLPSWAESPEDFWSAADEHERANARVYREIEFALPRELDRAAQVKLAHDFTRDFTAEHGLAYTLAVHDTDGSNPHAHLMWCERGDDGIRRDGPEHFFKQAYTKDPSRGGAAKVAEMRGRDWIASVRKDWELAANTALELAGERERVDCRSYAEQDRDKPEHERRIPQIHLGVQTLVLERKGIVTSRRQRWLEIEAERAERERELAARQTAARAQRQREHMEAVRSRMEPKREKPAPEPVNPFEPPTLEEAPARSAFELDTLESPPPYVSPMDEMTREELAAWEKEHCLTPHDALQRSLERDAERYREQLEREQDERERVAQEKLDRQTDVLVRLRELNPGLEVEDYTEAYHQTRQPLAGLYLDWDAQEGLGFVKVAENKVVAMEAPAEHEALRGKKVELGFDEDYAVTVALQLTKEQQAERAIREYKQNLANKAEKQVVNLTHQEKFVGKMLGDVEVAGQRLAVVEGRSRILIIPSQPDLSAQKGKMVAVRTKVTPDNELIAEVGSVRRKRDKGMER